MTSFSTSASLSLFRCCSLFVPATSHYVQWRVSLWADSFRSTAALGSGYGKSELETPNVMDTILFE